MGFLKQADPGQISPDTYRDLEIIRSVCNVCQREAAAPHIFCVAPPNEKCRINRTISMNIMKLENTSVLHVVDKDTKFGAACFLQGESTSKILEAFFKIWVPAYVGFPEIISVDQKSRAQSDGLKC